MYCLKCGKETTESHVFCDRCLDTMEKYPVKPETAVHLPHREMSVPVKKAPQRKRKLTAEEQVSMLKKTTRRLIAAVAVLCVILGLTTGLLVHNLLNRKPVTTVVGRNYTINTNQQP